MNKAPDNSIQQFLTDQGLPAPFAQDFAHRLPARYFQRFNRETQALHAQALHRLSPENPVEVILENRPDKSVECTVLAFDHVSVFAIIAGILASLGLNIVSGDVFTYAPAPPPEASPARSRPRRPRPNSNLARRRIVDHFSCRLEDSGMPLEKWRIKALQRFREIFAILETAKPREAVSRAKQRVDEAVAERLAALAGTGESRMSPIDIEFDNQADAFTRLKVVSEDTPAFLYSFANALASRKISIEHVKIRTAATRIEDEIDIVDAHRRKITDQTRLDQIKFSALLTKHFTYFLGSSPNPFDALCRFERIIDDILQMPEQGKWAELLDDPKILHDLASLLGASDFMWEDFIRQQYESLLPMMVPQVKGRRFSLPPEQLRERLRQTLAEVDSCETQKQRLNEFKDREIFMIDLDHILTPEVDFKALAAALTALAEAVIEEAAAIVHRQLADRFGIPRTVAGMEARYSLLGLGKMGGAALGYASDIELLMVYSDNGETDGREKIDNAEFFSRMMREVSLFIEAKQEGIFNLDLRLRPHGNDGPLACSLENFCRYYGQSGSAHAFERLALVRLRRLAGDSELGRQVERLRDEIVYFSSTIDLSELRELRLRQFHEKNQPGKLNAKFSPGGLVDLEYDAQILQVMYGREEPKLRTPRLHQALEALTEAGVISDDEGRRLTNAYDFLRRLINGLRMLRGSARDLFLPSVESDEFTHLARRMGYRRGEKLSAAQQLRLDFETCTAAVRAFVERHFGRDSLPGANQGNIADLILSDNVNHELARGLLEQAGYRNPQRALVNLRRLCRDPASRETFARLAILACDLLRHQPDPDMALNNWEKFMVDRRDYTAYYRMLLSQPMRLEMLLAIFSASQFLADTLVRNPQFLDWLTQPRILHDLRSRHEIEQDLRLAAAQADDYSQWLDRLRILRRREILRIGARDICLHLSTEDIIGELSNLAEAVAQVAFEQARDHLARQTPETAGAPPLADRLCILAFGKLGGGELNYSSDIDLLAICEAATSPPGREEMRFCARLMEMTCAALDQHTGEGYAYRVDLRLRPYGKAGEIVHTGESLLEYYRKTAALWEIQALLKLRPIVGNLSLGEKFLAQVRPLLTRPRDRREIGGAIEQMRKAAIKQGEARIIRHGVDVKNGRGGIRDIEFLVQARQLELAGRHPELIVGHTLTALRRLAELQVLSADTARQLEQDYLLLRQVEHCLQIFEDRQVHTLPVDDDEATALARRLFGPSADHRQLRQTVRECGERVRQAYQQTITLPNS